MKRLKRFLCLMLIVPFMFLFSACGKDDGDSSGTGGSETGGGSEQSQELTSQQVFALASSKFDACAQNEYEDTKSYCSKEDDEYVYESFEYSSVCFEFLKAMSLIENLQENVWCYGETLQNIETGKIDKVFKFKISKETGENVETYFVYAMFNIKGIDFEENNKTYDLFYGEIKYYPLIENVAVDVLIEKSRNNNGVVSVGSTASCFAVSFASGDISASSFLRNADVDANNLDELNLNSIKPFKLFKFNSTRNTVIEQIEGFKHEYLTSIQLFVQEKLLKLEEVFVVVSNEENVATTKIEGLTAKFSEVLEKIDVIEN